MIPSHRYDVLVIGAGPAGIAAALAASSCGVNVAVADDNIAPGGQIWRNEARRQIESLRRSPAKHLSETTIFDAPRAGVVTAQRRAELIHIEYRKLILATGARELWIPFPGWTLPNVMGAGGLQAFVKNGLPIHGKRVVIAGSGPLLLAVAAYLKRNGARVQLIAEQASSASLARFVWALRAYPAKLAASAALRVQLGTTRYLPTCWPIEAKGGGRLSSVVLQHGSRSFEIECDYLACGFGLVPNTELALLVGCAVDHGAVRVDRDQQTTVPGVFCAGEAAGVGGSDIAQLEGEVAGFVAAGHSDKAEPARQRLSRMRPFAEHLQRAFALRPELQRLPHDDSVVCRCEDVFWKDVKQQPDWRSAKLQTRCGMGPCQGRVCGASLEFLLGWHDRGIRNPIYPVRVDHLIDPE